MATKTKEKKMKIALQGLNLKTLKIPIVGKTPLLMDKMTDAVKEGILAKQTGVAKGNKKLVRDTADEIVQAIHKTSTGKIGFPAAGFKFGMMESTSFVGDIKFSKKLVSGSIRIINSQEGLIPIKFKKQKVLQHNISHNTKFTPMFEDWSCEIQVMYDANNISATDILTLVNYAGFYIGVGAWRPKSRDGGSGEYGCYEVKGGKK